jgi:energy-coupling factor transport system permease protein
VSFLPAPLEPVRAGFLTRVAPVSRLTAGAVWLVAALVTIDPLVPAVLLGAGGLALVFLSGLPLSRLPARLAPLFLAGAVLAAVTIVFHTSAGDPSARVVAELGPLRVTATAVSAGLALFLRLAVVAVTSVLVFAPSDATRLADSLTQQWHLPDRVAYGTLAALHIAPRIAVDWAATGAVRRLRGIEPRGPVGHIRSAGGRLLTLLVSAIRRAGRMALAMDARGFDAGTRRSRYRPVKVGPFDWLLLAGAVAIAAAALLVSRVV